MMGLLGGWGFIDGGEEVGGFRYCNGCMDGVLGTRCILRVMGYTGFQIPIGVGQA